MNTVFIKSKINQSIPSKYSSGVIIGPVSRKARCGFSHTLDKLLCRPKEPDELVRSFALVAIASYIADKTYRRATTQDSWTRKLFLNIPVSKGFLPALPFLKRGLQFVSGDLWEIEPREENTSLGLKTYYKDNFIPEAVSLFSGGTDSLTAAINFYEEGTKTILVSHFESGVHSRIQKKIVRELTKYYGPDIVRHRSIQVCAPISNETSTRARSFLFISLGLLTASAFGEEVPLYVPENGFVGLNIPLSGSRLGSYSTRTTHPEYFKNIREALERVAIKHKIINPFLLQSKGEILQSCKNKKLLKKLIPMTVSCSKSGSLRWKKISPSQNCGRCYPCLVRRAALHAIDADDPSHYVYDAVGNKRTLTKDVVGKDIRCFLQAVSKYKKSHRTLLFEMLKTGSISDISNQSKLTKIIGKGLKEFENLIGDKGCAEIKRYFGI